MPTSTPSKALYVTSASLVASIVLWRATGAFLNYYFTNKLTILNDIPSLGQSRRKEERIRGTAVVCGASIAGLLTARVCADHFENVVIIESEASLTEAKNDNTEDFEARYDKRNRVAHYTALHAHQPVTVDSLRKLFPAWDQEASSSDVLMGPADFRFSLAGLPLHTPYHLFADRTDMPQTILATRPTYERLLRKLVRNTCPNVEFRAGTVTDVVPAANERIEAVKVRKDNGTSYVQNATLVADCTGSNQDGLKWLAKAGYGAPQTRSQLPLDKLLLQYDQRSSLTTVDYPVSKELKAHLPIPGPQHHTGWLFNIHPIPDQDCKVFMAKWVTKDRIELAFGGWGHVLHPKKYRDIVDYIDTLLWQVGETTPRWIVELVTLLSRNESKPKFRKFVNPPSTYIRYHLGALPSNFVAIGDSAMRLNPLYGHGCTKACIGAVTLDAQLHRVKKGDLPHNFGKRFFAAQDARTVGMWSRAKDLDYSFETTIPIPGEEKLMREIIDTGGGFRGKLFPRLLQIAQADEEVNEALWNFFMMLTPDTDIFRPSIMLKLAWHIVRGCLEPPLKTPS